MHGKVLILRYILCFALMKDLRSHWHWVYDFGTGNEKEEENF